MCPDLVGVVWELEVDAAAVQVEPVAEDVVRHGRALDVPPARLRNQEVEAQSIQKESRVIWPHVLIHTKPTHKASGGVAM